MRAVRNENIICIHMLLKGGAKVGQFDAQGFNTFDFLKRPNENICNILYSAGEDFMTDGGHSRIVSVENPKLDILNIEYSEPGDFAVYMSGPNSVTCVGCQQKPKSFLYNSSLTNIIQTL